MTDSDSQAFEESIWGAVADGETALLTKEEMANVLWKVESQLRAEHAGRR